MKYAIIILFMLGLLIGCTTTQKGAAVGGAAGAGIGAIIGKQSGNTGTGAGIGAAAGAAVGAIVGEQMDSKFCPTCGRRYTGGKQYCPIDGTELQEIQK